MGSRLCPVILETSVIESLSFQIPLYFIYLDDILLCLPEHNKSMTLNSFHALHSKIKFTMERVQKNCINSLDLSTYNN